MWKTVPKIATLTKSLLGKHVLSVSGTRHLENLRFPRSLVGSIIMPVQQVTVLPKKQIKKNFFVLTAVYLRLPWHMCVHHHSRPHSDGAAKLGTLLSIVCIIPSITIIAGIPTSFEGTRWRKSPLVFLANAEKVSIAIRQLAKRLFKISSVSRGRRNR